MKELSIEGKATRYDQAIKVAKSKIKNDKDHVLYEDDIIEIFPELKESEDERIRKWLIALIEWSKSYAASGITSDEAKEMTAWLEKQKTSDEALQYLKENHSPSEVSDFQAAMNIAVAKAYDKGYNDGLKKQDEQKPVWSEEDATHYNRILKELNLQKEMPINASVIEEVKSDIIWFKSLKDRVLPQPKQEWSEEDEKMLAEFLHKVEVCDLLTNREDVWITKKLKSLRPQSQWKPSDEQMRALKEACDEHWELDGLDPLYKLYQDLKKLREE